MSSLKLDTRMQSPLLGPFLGLGQAVPTRSLGRLRLRHRLPHHPGQLMRRRTSEAAPKAARSASVPTRIGCAWRRNADARSLKKDADAGSWNEIMCTFAAAAKKR